MARGPSSNGDDGPKAVSIEALRQLIASFTVDTSGVKKGLNEADSKIEGTKKLLLDLGKGFLAIFAAQKVYGFAKGIVDQADALSKQAATLGLSVSSLQEWQHAAGLSGVEAESFTASVVKLQKALSGAREGKGDVFKSLGIDPQNADKTWKSTEQVLDEVTAKIASMQDPIARNAALLEAFGKSGAKLVPLFAGGVEGVKALRAEVKDLGFGIDQEFASEAEAVNDNVERLEKVVQGLGIKVLSRVLPIVVGITDGLITFSKWVLKTTGAVKDWFARTKLLEAGLTGLGVKIASLALRLIPQLVKGLGRVIYVYWPRIVSGLRVAIPLFLRLAVVAARFLAPLLLLDDILTFFAGGESKFGDLLDGIFGEGTAKKAQEFFADFVNAPDKIRTAFNDLPDVVKNFIDYALFLVNALSGGWDNFGDKMSALWDGIKLVFEIAWTEIKFGGLAVAAALSDAFAGVWNGLVDGATNAIRKLASLASKLPGFGDKASALSDAANAIQGARMNDHAGADISAQWDAARMGLAASYDDIGARMKAPAAAPAGTTNVDTTVNQGSINVTVQGGPNSAETGRRVGEAVSKARGGQDQAFLKQLKAATVPGGG